MKDKFNKDFEDFGWSEMQKMLDRELPVAEKKRRRGLVFWLFLIGGLITIGGTFIYESKIKNLELNTPVNNVAVKNSNSNVANNEIKNNNATLINNELKNNNSNLINNELKNNNLTLINNELKNNNSNLINNELKNNNLTLINNELKNNNSNLINNELKNNNLTLTNSINNAIDATQGTLITIEQLFALNNKPLKEIESDSMAMNDLKGINTPIKYALIKPIFTTKTHWGITTGVNTEGSKIVDGWQLGLVVNHVFKPKLSISTGLNYRKTRINGNAALTYYQVELKSTGIYTPSPTPAKKVALNELTYLELPIHLNYHFNEKWSVSTGIKTAYLMSANVVSSSDSTLFVLPTGTNNKDLTLADFANKSNNVTALGLQRWDFAAIGGLNFRPTKRLELSLRYDFGLKNVLNQTNWSAYNRFIGLNATYYFK